MDRKLKGIPVYAIVLILVSGTALGAGIWFLTVDVPVDYDEPVEITMYDERDGEETYVQLRDTHEYEDGPVDMTYQSFYQYVEFDNPSEGITDLEIEVSLSVEGTTEENPIGFAVFNEEEIDPQDVEWTEDGDVPDTATYTETGEEVDVEWDTDTFTTEPISTPGQDYWTVIYTFEDPPEDGAGDPTITWEFVDVTDV